MRTQIGTGIGDVELVNDEIVNGDNYVLMVFLRDEEQSRCWSASCFVAFLVEMDKMKRVPAVTKSGPLSQTPQRSRTYGKTGGV